MAAPFLCSSNSKMSYANREVSTADSSPVELYEFRRGGDAWRYTSASDDALYGSYEYLAVPVKRSSIEQSTEMGKTGLRITFARDIEVAQDFIDRKSTRLNSSHVRISYAVFCLKKKKNLIIASHAPATIISTPAHSCCDVSLVTTILVTPNNRYDYYSFLSGLFT